MSARAPPLPAGPGAGDPGSSRPAAREREGLLMMATNWLRELARDSLGDFEATSALDSKLSDLAEWAQLRETTSLELLTCLAWKIERWVRRYRGWDLEPFDLDDVRQEAYLVFLATLRRWQPRYVNGAPTGYLYYFLDVFPRWLATRVRRWRGPSRPPVVRLVHPVNPESSALNDFCRNLDPRDTTLVELRLKRGLSVTHAANQMGIDRSTAYRRWNRILDLGRAYLRETG